MVSGMFEKIFIAGGAGFIGSHFAIHLLSMPKIKRVTVYDNFTSGKQAHLDLVREDSRLTVIKADIKNNDALMNAMRDHDTVIHLASNPDIARAAIEPTIDFNEGAFLTERIIEAMRITGVKRILYASGSGVYGEVGEVEMAEDHGPLLPISTYGASKLAGEAFICSYAHLFGIEGIAFRFGNVVGPNQTHGVGYDFICKLRENRHELVILGDGYQSKSYVYITDIISAVLLANEKCQKPFDVFNVATGDYVTVRDIAESAIKQVVGNNTVKLIFTGGDRGWKGDVPVIRLNTDKIRLLGWKQNYNSAEAIQKSLTDMLSHEGIQ